MFTLSFPSHMLRQSRVAPGPLPLEPGSWNHVVEQLNDQLPALAAHVLTGSGELLSGFAVVVNGHVARDVRVLRLEDGDEMVLIPFISGG